jgi:hypothetical protein
MSNWSSIAKRTNSLPPGWSTPDEIAADLDCEINEVPKILAAAIREKQVEKENFPHWQPGCRQLLYQTGYRLVKPGTNAKPASPVADELTDAVRRVAARHPDFPPNRIVDYLPPRIRRGVTSAQVVAILNR